MSITPKPGLVDRNNNGAHKDMDFFTFMASAAHLGSYYQEMIYAGYKCKGTPQDLFLELRRIGKKAEKAMFKATQNVNTHKGLIFSLGVICGAAGYFYKKEQRMDCEAVLALCGDMTKTLIEREFREIDERQACTKGETLYKEYGIRGIRGEVADGFPNVRLFALPCLRKFKDAGRSLNETFVYILLLLMSRVEDTNVLARHNRYTLEYVHQQAQIALGKGGTLTEEGMKAICEMDKRFIEQHISPGGCADLLAVTIMMDLIQKSY